MSCSSYSPPSIGPSPTRSLRAAAAISTALMRFSCMSWAAAAARSVGDRMTSMIGVLFTTPTSAHAFVRTASGSRRLPLIIKEVTSLGWWRLAASTIESTRAPTVALDGT